jgi:hypothetical protein
LSGRGMGISGAPARQAGYTHGCGGGSSCLRRPENGWDNVKNTY